MSEPTNEPTELKCECTHCGGHILYPPEAEGVAAGCPHCQQETVLAQPKPKPTRVFVVKPRARPPGEVSAGPQAGGRTLPPPPQRRQRVVAPIVDGPRLCPNCDAPVEADAVLCIECGTRLPKVKVNVSWKQRLAWVRHLNPVGWWRWARAREWPPKHILFRYTGLLVCAALVVVIYLQWSSGVRSRFQLPPEVKFKILAKFGLAKKVVLPPSGPDLEIKSFVWEKSKDSNFVFVKGTVVNYSPYRYFAVKVEFDLLNSQGAPIGVVSDYIAVIEPKKTWAFKVLVNDSDAVKGKPLGVEGRRALVNDAPQ